MYPLQFSRRYLFQQESFCCDPINFYGSREFYRKLPFGNITCNLEVGQSVVQAFGLVKSDSGQRASGSIYLEIPKYHQTQYPFLSSVIPEDFHWFLNNMVAALLSKSNPQSASVSSVNLSSWQETIFSLIVSSIDVTLYVWGFTYRINLGGLR